MPDPAAELHRVLNEAPAEELTERYKIAPEVVEEIVGHRPYQSDVDILERAILPKRTYEQLATQIVTILGSEEVA
jgi:DNA uptake protein ComE-like DNA-binding protein